jgi:UDP-N-acetylglucosamine 2-epimerase (non-hydrolysing)
VIAFVYGTTAELIKIAPIHARLVELGVQPLHWCTAQQAGELPSAAEHLGMPAPDVLIANGVDGRSLRTTTDAVRWLGTVLANSAVRHRELRRSLRADGRSPFVLVHGDTLTTLLGAALGRTLGATVGHVEAGLRSFDLRNPFPEELDRVVTARLARVHYAPSEDAVHNLRKVRGAVVATGGNTVRDSLHLVPEDYAVSVGPLPAEYGLVSLHRMELIHDVERFSATMQTLAAQSESVPLLQVVDPLTHQQLVAQGLGRLHDGERFRGLGKLDYFDFIGVLRNASFVVTDSGGLQEECAGLGVPCLVHRLKTERSDGIGENALLSGFDLDVLRSFLDDPLRYRTLPTRDDASPSDVIVADLVRRGAV